MAELHGILEPDFLQTAEGNCKVLVSLVQKKTYMTVDIMFDSKCKVAKKLLLGLQWFRINSLILLLMFLTFQ